MRLIDADALLDFAFEQYCKECDKRIGIKAGEWRVTYEVGETPGRACSVNDFRDIVENSPTIEAKTDEWCDGCSEYDQERHCCPRFNRVIRKTVEEVKANFSPKTGRWIMKEGIYGVAYCSECDFELHINNTNYCPYCGARMVEGEEDE